MTTYNLTPGQAWDALLAGEQVRASNDTTWWFRDEDYVIDAEGRILDALAIVGLFMQSVKWRSRKKPREWWTCGCDGSKLYTNRIDAGGHCTVGPLGYSPILVREVVDE